MLVDRHPANELALPEFQQIHKCYTKPENQHKFGNKCLVLNRNPQMSIGFKHKCVKCTGFAQPPTAKMIYEELLKRNLFHTEFLKTHRFQSETNMWFSTQFQEHVYGFTPQSGVLGVGFEKRSPS